MWKWCEIQMAMFVNKALLESSQACWFPCLPWLVSHLLQWQSWVVANRDHMAIKPKLFALRLVTEKFADPPLVWRQIGDGWRTVSHRTRAALRVRQYRVHVRPPLPRRCNDCGLLYLGYSTLTSPSEDELKQRMWGVYLYVVCCQEGAGRASIFAVICLSSQVTCSNRIGAKSAFPKWESRQRVRNPSPPSLHLPLLSARWWNVIFSWGEWSCGIDLDLEWKKSNREWNFRETAVWESHRVERWLQVEGFTCDLLSPLQLKSPRQPAREAPASETLLIATLYIHNGQR